MKFWTKLFSKKPKQYDPIEHILEHIRFNTNYVKSGILFRDNYYINFDICSIKFYTDIKSNKFVLTMNIINSKNVLVASEDNECIICNEQTNTAVNCCKKNMCQECINKWRETCQECFICPHCRKNHNGNKHVLFSDSDLDTFLDDGITIDEKLEKIANLI